MADQSEQQFNAAVSHVIATAPEGLSEEQFNALVEQQLNQPMPSHDGPSTADRVLSSLPTLGGMAGGIAGGRSNPVGIALSGLGGAAGETVRQIGDLALHGEASTTPRDATGQLRKIAGAGLEQAGMEGAFKGVGSALKAVARPIMRGAIPRAIAKNFDDVNLAEVALQEGAIPGSKRSAASVAVKKDAAGQALSDRANFESRIGFPRIKADDTLKGVEQLESQAVSARKLDRAGDIRDSMAKTRGEYGPTGLNQNSALNRKQILQQEGKAAMNAPSPRQAALDPQVADAERAGLTAQLRTSPKMGAALDKSQGLIGLDRVMQEQMHSNPLTRLRSGGVASALASPMGLGAAAQGTDLIGKMTSQYGPALTRAAILAALGQEQE